MRRSRFSAFFICLFFLLLLSSSGSFVKGEESVANPILSTNADTLVLQKLFARIDSLKEESSGELLAAIGGMMINIPYEAQTLEIADPECLVINLRAFDCLTFVETSLALGQCKMQRKLTIANYYANLKKIRYRDGVINDYTSRLHYFIDWVFNNEKKGILSNISDDMGGIERRFPVSFMTTHHQLYPQMAKHPFFLLKMRKIENELSRKIVSYIPKNDIPLLMPEIQTGDIVAFVTKINGLDVAHTAIAVWDQGILKFLHASSITNRVELSKDSLWDYTRNVKNHDGLIVLRVN